MGIQSFRRLADYTSVGSADLVILLFGASTPVWKCMVGSADLCTYYERVVSSADQFISSVEEGVWANLSDLFAISSADMAIFPSGVSTRFSESMVGAADLCTY